MEAHQALPSLGFSRQEHWSGLPFPSLVHESKSESEVTQSCPTVSDPMDCNLPGSSVHGIFQARVLEWVAIAFSNARDSPPQKNYLVQNTDRAKVEALISKVVSWEGYRLQDQI